MTVDPFEQEIDLDSLELSAASDTYW
jgi:hypothetical protein